MLRTAHVDVGRNAGRRGDQEFLHAVVPVDRLDIDTGIELTLKGGYDIVVQVLDGTRTQDQLDPKRGLSRVHHTYQTQYQATQQNNRQHPTFPNHS